MKSIYVKNTYDLKISGKPSHSIEEAKAPKEVAVLPSAIPFINAKALVKEGDKVEIGTKLFIDKLMPECDYLSPGAGTVSKITLGPRRRLDEIVITLDDNEKRVKLTSIASDKIGASTQEEVIAAVLQSGTWPLLRAFPFNKVASPSKLPTAIYVVLDNDEPFHPLSEVYLKDEIDTFRTGIRYLKKICGDVFVGASAKNLTIKKDLHNTLTHTIEGAYPANSPGVFHYYNKQSAEDNNAWYINGQDVLLLAKALLKGEYPTERTVIVSGSLAKNRVHFKTRIGVPFATLINNQEDEAPTRYIGGGVFTGRRSERSSYLALHETALHMLPEGKEDELMAFIKPGAQKASFSNTFISRLFPEQALKMNTSLNGGYRACVACSACPQVCPVGLYPQFLLRELESNDIESAINLGLLDCTECGLCSYVCPSKIELSGKISEAKRQLAKEV